MPVKVTRWTRFGYDRLYVKSNDGVELGWWDLQTGQANPTRAGSVRILADAASDWKARQGTLPHHPPPPHPFEPAPIQGPDFAQPPGAPRFSPPPADDVGVDWGPPVGQPIRDLALNGPGASLYEQVEVARAAGQKPTFLRRLLLGKNAYSSWERGLIGEQLVEAELHKLARRDHTWGYLNSIPVGENGADIDHLVAGPGGVFTINTKHHRGANIWVGGDTFMVNGTRHPYVRNARFEASRASKLLSKALGTPVGILGLIVSVNARNFTIRQQPRNVHVINRARLVDFLQRMPVILTPEQVHRLLSVARISSTWES